MSGVVEWVQAGEKVLLCHGYGPQPTLGLDSPERAGVARVVPLGRFNLGLASSSRVVKGGGEVRISGSENHDVVQAVASQIDECQGAQDVDALFLPRCTDRSLDSIDVLPGVFQRSQRHVDYSVVTPGPLCLLGLVASVCIVVIFWDGQATKDLNPGDLYLVHVVVRRVASLSELAGEPVRIDECILGRTPWRV